MRSVLLDIVEAGEMRKERIGEPVNKGRNWAAGKSFSRIISKFQTGRGAEERGAARDLAKQSFRRTNNYPGKRKPLGKGEGERERAVFPAEEGRYFAVCSSEREAFSGWPFKCLGFPVFGCGQSGGRPKVTEERE